MSSGAKASPHGHFTRKSHMNLSFLSSQLDRAATSTPSGSSSAVSGTNPSELFKKSSMIILTPTSDRFGTERNKYTLNQIIDHLQLSMGNLVDEIKREHQGSAPKVINDHLVSKCIDYLCTQVGIDCTTVVNNEVPCLSGLSPILCSTHIRPDVMARNSHHQYGLYAEVLSSPMIKTEYKALLVGINVLRLLQCNDNTIYDIDVFVFPKRDVSRFIGKIHLSWDGLQVTVCYKIYDTIQEGLDAVVVSARNNWHVLNRPILKDYLFLLSKSHYQKLCAKCVAKLSLNTSLNVLKQYKSQTHIILLCTNGTVIKLIYSFDEKLAYLDGTIPNDDGVMTHLIKWKLCSIPAKIMAVCYKKVFYDPLSTAEAGQCLKDFVEKTARALNHIHSSLGRAHNDVRLPNICFNENFEVIFIDLERVTEVDQTYTTTDKVSCIYDKIECEVATRGASSDFVQLGWLVAWVLHQTADYHKRSFDTQPKLIKKNKFVDALINRGDYSPQLLQQSLYESLTVAEVLRARPAQSS